MLNEIIEYTALENIQAAYRMFEEIDNQIAILEAHPYAGRSGRIMDTRELVIVRTPSIVAYQIVENTVHILRILHGCRKWPQNKKPR